ncbi:uncharacterized protein LOC112462849 [Temnothorax curvispinosus]|uniref:Uncharacterized protein LOC112462849 n=1 Tax=Temnothorax curvispinosus TaxID=300111 RepID=A0A6J1QRY7_9HYME|nr:uncharacterized protein LOC112462849 [Temnothorax curvispinosus]
MALNRQCVSVLNNVSEENVTISRLGMRPVISDNHERVLINYILHSSDIYFGLSAKEVRKLAYEYGKRLDLSIPPSWNERKIAGENWFSDFLKRHPNLSIRKPQATSLARATAFNRTTVAEFFKNLKTIYERFQLNPRSIYNMDETGITTVQTPERIMNRRGFKQIGH